MAFTVSDARAGEPLGSTRYLALRPEHRVLEIGWTWVSPGAWRTGANTEAKLLLMQHAFEKLGCMRVEFKTDALNTRARAALESLPAQFEGISRKHMLVRDGTVRELRTTAVGLRQYEVALPPLASIERRIEIDRRGSGRGSAREEWLPVEPDGGVAETVDRQVFRELADLLKQSALRVSGT